MKENKPNPMDEKDTDSLISIAMEGYEVIEKQVKKSGNSGRVYLPNDWIGGKVKIIRLTPLEELEDEK